MFYKNTKMALLAALVSGASPVYAATIASGPSFLGTQTFIQCRFINLGTTSIIPTQQDIWEAGTTTPIPSTPTCQTGVAVVPGQTCNIEVSVTNAHSHSCSVTYTGANKFVRGVMDVEATGSTTDVEVNLQ